jgi:hypothetical protein
MAKKNDLSPEQLAEKNECIALLTARAEELGRLPTKADMGGEPETARIKRALGPWPRALEKAGLKTPRQKKNSTAQRKINKAVRQTDWFLEKWDAELERARKGKGRAREVFFARLWMAALIVPLSPDKHKAALLKAPDGGLYIPAFTSKREYKTWDRAGDMPMQHDSAQLLHLIKGDAKLAGIVVNPFGKQLVLSRENLDSIEKKLAGMSEIIARIISAAQ